MTTPRPTVWSAAPASGGLRSCPMCRLRRASQLPKHVLYGTSVCRKCLYGLTNRRQLAFVVDCLVLSAACTASVRLMMAWLSPPPQTPDFLMDAFTLLWIPLFAIKDGWDGRSPGKRLLGLRVVRTDSLESIGPTRSLKRNLLIAAALAAEPLGRIAGPLLGATPAPAVKVISVLVILWLGERLTHGLRPGDRWAGARVIWQRYAHRPPFVPTGRYCVECGYDLRGNVSGVCPECGAPVESREYSAVIAAAE